MSASTMEHMLLAVLLSAGSVVLLLAMGLLTDELIGDDAEDWARRVMRETRPRKTHR